MDDQQAAPGAPVGSREDNDERKETANEDLSTDKSITKEPRFSKHNGWVFSIKWAATILAAAASILFGIWAPLSYQMTKDGNRENNDVQSSMLQAISEANRNAQEALKTASVQNEWLQNANSMLYAAGVLSFLQYCRQQDVGQPIVSKLNARYRHCQ